MGKGSSAPDNSAQEAELRRQREEAQANADRLADQRLEETNARRRRQRGKSLLTATSEFGVESNLGK